jgi:hypothetical protein
MKTFLFAAIALGLCATPALAKGKAKRHCVGKDGSEMADAKNRKECKAAGGKWKKMKADADAAAAPPADAAK